MECYAAAHSVRLANGDGIDDIFGGSSACIVSFIVRFICNRELLVRLHLYLGLCLEGRDLCIRVLSLAHGGVLSIAYGRVLGLVSGFTFRRILGFVLDGVSGLLICLGRVGLTVSLGSVPGLFLDLGNILCLCRLLSLRGRCLVALRESGEGQHAHEHREQQQNGQKRLP